jgi:hypothetical protein
MKLLANFLISLFQKKKYFLAAIILLPAPHALKANLTISRHSVSWTVEGTPQNGTYANGDPWVVGPITIVEIDPKPSTGRNGTILNPTLGSSQGFDDRIGTRSPYNDALNQGTKLPLNISGPSSIVSSISNSNNVSLEQIESFSILTIVTNAPPPNSFRPSYLSGDFNHPWTESDLDYQAFAALPKSAILHPSVTDTALNFERCWYEQDLNWTGRALHTPYMGNGSGYGKKMAIMTGDAILLLNLDFNNSEKRDLLVNLVQYGIDIYGIIKAGGQWYADGGHNCGRLSPLLAAAMALNEPGMKNQLSGALMNFQEFQQTFYVSEADILRSHTGPKPPYLNYTNSDLGKPEWGITHYIAPNADNKYWDAAYRDIGGGVLQAPAIAAKLMKAKQIIDHDAFFDYANRHIYYRESLFTNRENYNGYDNDNAYGQGSVNNLFPIFGYNETPSFHRDFYLIFKDTLPNSPGFPSPPSNLKSVKD